QLTSLDTDALCLLQLGSLDYRIHRFLLSQELTMTTAQLGAKEKLLWFQDVQQWFSQARHFHTDSSVRFVHGTLNSSPLGIILKDFLRIDPHKLHDPH
ncbi:MAG: hypothetical protein VXW29_05300, partial [SAR324 cluster bacterium]|nr:hypothetical protein [SAR324 cluster bacterium]